MTVFTPSSSSPSCHPRNIGNDANKNMMHTLQRKQPTTTRHQDGCHVMPHSHGFEKNGIIFTASKREKKKESNLMCVKITAATGWKAGKRGNEA